MEIYMVESYSKWRACMTSQNAIICRVGMKSKNILTPLSDDLSRENVQNKNSVVFAYIFGCEFDFYDYFKL